MVFLGPLLHSRSQGALVSTYFQGLNYGLANEDTWIEYNLAPQNADSFFSVCGSGSRVTPLLAKNPKHLHIVDLSETQLASFRLRLAAIKHLDYEDYLFFLGYVKVSKKNKKRSELMRSLKLTSEDEVLWKAQLSLWENVGFIYLGKWEQHFMKMGRIFQKLTFTDTRPIFEAKNLEEQKEILTKYWHPKIFRLYTKMIMNEYVANKLLYKGHYAGATQKKTMEVSAAEFVYREVNDLFQNTWVRGNYFLNMIFLNEVSHPDCYPTECDETVFNLVKKAETQLHFHRENLLLLLLEKPHDFYSLSDTFSYMLDEEVKDFLLKLPPGIKTDSQIVIRTFMRKPGFTVVKPWVTDVEKNQRLAHLDCTRMYEMSVLKKL